jgi:glycosyltransferase involved in cell wall biosynthesis
MFVHGVPAYPYREPWHQTLESRLADLGAGSPRVAYVHEEPNPSTFRYRVLNMIEALRTAHPRVGAAWFVNDDRHATDAIAERADAVVICRTRYSSDVTGLVTRARARGARVLFDIDDLVFDDRFTPLIVESLDQPVSEKTWAHWFSYVSRLGATMRLCDAVIVPTEELASRAADFSGLPVHVIPNFLNTAQIELSEQILAAKTRTAFARDDRFHFGYFSGSQSHNHDFALVTSALEHLLVSDPRVVVRIVGLLDVPGSLDRFGARIETYPLQDFMNLQRLIGEVEINLVPLQDNAFARCKSPLKVFEASAVGTVSVASPRPNLADAIRDRETGYLARTVEWEDVLDAAMGSLEGYPAMATAAAEAAFARYSPTVHGARVASILFDDEGQVRSADDAHAAEDDPPERRQAD